jgi:microcystin-dependent protein
MNPDARINTPLRNYFFYKSGEFIRQPLEDGFISFFENADHSTPLNVYQDSDLTIPYENPLPLDGDGGCPPIYLQDAPYYIEVRSSIDTGNLLQFSLDNYEGAVISGGVTPTGDGNKRNYFIDGQFDTLDWNDPTEDGIIVISPANWQFERDGSASDVLTYYQFVPGDTDVPQNPLQALQYYTNATPSGQTVSRFYQPFRYVRTLEGTEVTLSFWGRAAVATTVTPFYEQFFGTGGSPSTTNNVPLTPVILTSTWTRYSQTFTIDSIGGKTLGTNIDDQLSVGINFPLNSVFDTFFTNMYLEEGADETEYPYETYEQVLADIGWVYPGELREFSLILPPYGWLDCDGSAVSRDTYIDLFQATTFLTTGVTTNTSPIITGIPSTGHLREGMQLTSAGFFTGVVTIDTVDSGTQITVSANAIQSGNPPIRFYLNGAGDGTTTFNVPNIQGRAIVGSGGSLLTPVGIGNTVASTGGDAERTLIVANLAQHSHTVTAPDDGFAVLTGPAGAGDNVGTGTANRVAGTPTFASSNTPNNPAEAFSIVQPVYVALVCIKY